MKPTSRPPAPIGAGGPAPPPVSRGREVEGKKEEGSQADSTSAPIRRSHTSRELCMLGQIENPPSKRARRPTRGAQAVDNSCEATRESNMICPITCGCRNSLVDIIENTRVVSHILRATRKIFENKLIACFGHTAAITNKDEIIELKKAQQDRNSDIYRTSVQYTVLGNIHGKVVYLVPPQDATLLLKDRLGKNLRKNLKLHNNMEGRGQLANHTCCDEHWNANLEVAAIEHEEDTSTTPMAILRARGDIEKDTETLARYWHQGKDAWLNIFECQCCACTNHTMTVMPTPTETVDTIATEGPAPVSDNTPGEIQGIEIITIPHHGCSQDCSVRAEEDYPESEMDDMDWNDLEQLPLQGIITRIIQLEKTPSPPQNTSPHSGQDTRQRNFEGQQDSSTNHKLGVFPNPTEVTHNVATNTTERPMQPSGKTP